MSSFLILNSFHTLFFCALVDNFEQVTPFLGRLIAQTKFLKLKSFLPFIFAIAKICVTIRLVDDETKMGSI